MLSGGSEGEEPPAEVKRLYEIYQEFPSTASRQDRAELERQASRIHAENVFMIGTSIFAAEGDFAYLHNSMRNVDTSVDYVSFETQNPSLFYKVNE